MGDREKILVDKVALSMLLSAIMGPSHHIREMQVTANMPDNPIRTLTSDLKDSVVSIGGSDTPDDFGYIGPGLKSELYHQLTKFGPVQDRPHELGSWILMMGVYLNKVAVAFATKTSDYQALEELRKATALGLSCGLQYKYPVREGYHDLING